MQLKAPKIWITFDPLKPNTCGIRLTLLVSAAFALQGARHPQEDDIVDSVNYYNVSVKCLVCCGWVRQ
jgi:hypothetical protein